MSKVDSRIARAKSLERSGQYREAMEEWRLLASLRHQPEFLVRAGAAGVEGGLYADAELLFREAIHSNPEEVEAYIRLGILCEERDQLSEAKQWLTAGLQLEERQEVLTILGSIERRLGDIEEARRILQRSLVLNPNDEEAHYGIALTCAQSDPVLSIQHFRRALEIDPQLPNAHRELGRVLWRMGDLDEAELCFRQAVGSSDTDAWSHNYLGHLLLLRGAYGDAEHAIARAVELEPSNGFFCATLADVYVRTGRSTEAEHMYLRALSVDMDDSQVNLRFGLFLIERGRLIQARRYLKRTIELDPSENRARRALDEIGAT